MHFGFAIDYHNSRLTYHPNTPHQHHTTFQGYHNVDWEQGEVHMVQQGPWMQPTSTHVPTKMWPCADRARFTDGADTPVAQEQQKCHPEFKDFFKKEYPELLTHDFEANSVKHGVVHKVETKPDVQPCKFKARPIPAAKAQSGKKAWMELLDAGIIRRSKSNWATPLHL